MQLGRIIPVVLIIFTSYHSVYSETNETKTFCLNFPGRSFYFRCETPDSLIYHGEVRVGYSEEYNMTNGTVCAAKDTDCYRNFTSIHLLSRYYYNKQYLINQNTIASCDKKPNYMSASYTCISSEETIDMCTTGEYQQKYLVSPGVPNNIGLREWSCYCDVLSANSTGVTLRIEEAVIGYCRSYHMTFNISSPAGHKFSWIPTFNLYRPVEITDKQSLQVIFVQHMNNVTKVLRTSCTYGKFFMKIIGDAIVKCNQVPYNSTKQPLFIATTPRPPPQQTFSKDLLIGISAGIALGIFCLGVILIIIIRRISKIIATRKTAKKNNSSLKPEQSREEREEGPEEEYAKIELSNEQTPSRPHIVNKPDEKVNKPHTSTAHHEYVNMASFENVGMERREVQEPERETKYEPLTPDYQHRPNV